MPNEFGTDMDRVLLGRTKDMKELSVSTIFNYLNFRRIFNTVSQKKGSSSGDQFQIFLIFCYGVMGRDGLTTLRPKKVRPDPLAGRPGPL